MQCWPVEKLPGSKWHSPSPSETVKFGTTDARQFLQSLAHRPQEPCSPARPRPPAAASPASETDQGEQPLSSAAFRFNVAQTRQNLLARNPAARYHAVTPSGCRPAVDAPGQAACSQPSRRGSIFARLKRATTTARRDSQTLAMYSPGSGLAVCWSAVCQDQLVRFFRECRRKRSPSRGLALLSPGAPHSPPSSHRRQASSSSRTHCRSGRALPRRQGRETDPARLRKRHL
jgi:hypothetical protein